MADLRTVPLARRGLLKGLIGLVAAPAIVRFETLMPVKAFRPLSDGKWYMEVAAGGGWHKADLNTVLLNGGPSFVLGPPDGFKAFEPGDVVQLAFDFDKNELWHRTKHT